MTACRSVKSVSVDPFSDVLRIHPEQHQDDRGYFLETWRRDRYLSIGVDGDFVQDNHSRSDRNVLRGMHFQHPNGQGKLVWVSSGEGYDVVVDVRRDSSTFGEWAGLRLSEADHEQIWVPEGFAHGFLALTEDVDLHYKCTAYYQPENEHVLRWDDPEVGIDWPIEDPTISDKDRDGRLLATLERAGVLPEQTEEH